MIPTRVPFRAVLCSAALGGAALAGTRVAPVTPRPAPSKEAAYVPRPLRSDVGW